MFKKKVAFALAVAMVTGSISGCGGFLKVSVGGKDIVNIGKAESTEKETEAMLETSEESKEEHTKKEIKAQVAADAEAWDKAKKTTFSGSGIRLTLPGEIPDTFVETTHMDQDYFTLTVFCDYTNMSLGNESSLNLYHFNAKQLGIRDAAGAKTVLFQACIKKNAQVSKAGEPAYTSVMGNDGNAWDVATVDCELSDGNTWKTVFATMYDGEDAYAVMYLDRGEDDFNMDTDWFEMGLELSGDADAHGTTGSGAEVDIQKLLGGQIQDQQNEESAEAPEKTDVQKSSSVTGLEAIGISDNDMDTAMTYMETKTVGDLTVYIPRYAVDYSVPGRSNGSGQQVRKSWELKYDDSAYLDHLTMQTFVTYSPASAFGDGTCYYDTVNEFKESIESSNSSYPGYVFSLHSEEYKIWLDESNDGYIQGEAFITHADGSCSTIETTAYYSGTNDKVKGRANAKALVCAQLLFPQK